MDVMNFFRAVGSGNLNEVKDFYEKDGKVPLNKNITYACGATWIIPLPLVTAFQKGYYDIAKFLMEKGADLDAFCRNTNKTPRDFMPKDFLANKEMNVVDDFLWKIRDGKFDDVKNYFVKHPGTVLNQNLVIYDKLYALPLAIAFKKKRNDIAKYLIECGADENAYCRKYDKFIKELKPKNF